jgi:hypothetical protein
VQNGLQLSCTKDGKEKEENRKRLDARYMRKKDATNIQEK